MDENPTPVQIEVALLKQRMDTMETRQDKTEVKVEAGFQAVDARFDKMDEKLTLILSKNPITDWFKENWKVAALLGFVVTYQPSIEMVKVIVSVLFPGINLG